MRNNVQLQPLAGAPSLSSSSSSSSSSSVVYEKLKSDDELTADDVESVHGGGGRESSLGPPRPHRDAGKWCSCYLCCCCCVRCDCTLRNVLVGFMAVGIFMGSLYSFVLYCFLPPTIPPLMIEPLTSAPAVFNGTVRVLFVGDSMFGIACRRYELRQKVAAFLPQYSMNLAVSGKSAVKARDLRQRLPAILRITHPDVVFLWENSDISNVNENFMSSRDIASSRSNYTLNMEWDVNYILNFQDTVSRKRVKNMALVGPGMLGEGPFLPRDPNVQSTWPRILPVVQKYDHRWMIDDFIKMNRAIASKFGIPHMDVKGLFQAHLPWYRLFYAGWVTTDGEHPNERGAVLIAREVATMLLQWFQHYNDSVISSPDHLPSYEFMDDEVTD